MEPSSSSSGAVNGCSIMRMTESLSQQIMIRNDMATTARSQAYLETKAVSDAKSLVAELCRQFYTMGWVSGTGGSVTVKVHDDSVPRPHQLIVMSPSGFYTWCFLMALGSINLIMHLCNIFLFAFCEICVGVQKERMVPEDMYVLSSDGFILSTPTPKPYPYKPPKCTDCALLFMKVYEMCNAGAVIHSHGMESCLVTMINPFLKEFQITHMEMIKGIQGHSYSDELVVPIIENTSLEGELTEPITEAIRAYSKTTAVLVRNHGVYIWGDSWISAKTQAECYHYLFDAAIKLHQLGLDWSTPCHGPIHNFNGVWGSGGNLSRSFRTGAFGLDYMIEPSQHCILLDNEGTATPITFITNVLVPYALDNLGKHLAATYDSEETQEDINLLRSQIQDDFEKGVVGAVPIPPDYVGKELGHIWRTGFQSNELVGVVFDDVQEALQKWHASGIKVYVYSSGSRESQQLLFAKSNYGDLRKYFCGFFDTTVGDKKETRSYSEIFKTVGVDKPSNILFVTDVFQEALAARAAGLEVILSLRPGNGPLPENHGFRTIESLLEI
ncbi:probable bifunctional methylthioribulose-1-phosphate dehydratase/enolase-phosphatase E1 2 isoform X3 [Hevea brasiliensis]|uniref:probable bifunctional methylthioribulose-1-phosphate dehydratase/enolase-phosphatase E1 2 isoform X3 n=1 Tax=Hevea brasiliensis TaxID=3981 RepID=UPI0025E27CE6|nr:probable bifunctional methylthioribulose-1-phosphate dehydratase/enolase-phosphatase E1 2 isoform X3 [Hevea brasiliensis]